jgi:hypothetical protein
MLCGASASLYAAMNLALASVAGSTYVVCSGHGQTSVELRYGWHVLGVLSCQSSLLFCSSEPSFPNVYQRCNDQLYKKYIDNTLPPNARDTPHHWGCVHTAACMLPCYVSGLLVALQRAAPIQSAAWQQLWSNSSLTQQSQPQQQHQASPDISNCAGLHNVDSSAPAHHNTDSSSNHSNSSMKEASKCGPCSSCTAQARVQGLIALPGLQAPLLPSQHKQLHAPQSAFASRAIQDSCLPSSSRGMAYILAAAGAEAGGTRARRSRRSVASSPASPAVDVAGNAGSASESASPTGNSAAKSNRRTSRTSSSARTAKTAGQAAAAAAGRASPPGQTAQEAQQLLGQLLRYCEAYYAGRPLVSTCAS